MRLEEKRLSSREIFKGKIVELRVDQVELPIQTERRLEALGLTLGSSVTVMNKKKHGAVIIKIRGTRFAVGKYIGDHIQVRKGA